MIRYGCLRKNPEDVVFYKERMLDNYQKISELEKKAEDFEYVKKCVGADEIDNLVAKAREFEKMEQKSKSYQHNYKWSR